MYIADSFSIPKGSEIEIRREGTGFINKVLWHFWSRSTFSYFCLFSAVRVTVHMFVSGFVLQCSVFLCEGVSVR